mmetsp:Transcript_26721/g.39094  ORF Transcript_26721/g.39094 Transcript_26721/m.39094 type:complete len:157 (+) Transcript_26721:182-652(+)
MLSANLLRSTSRIASRRVNAARTTSLNGSKRRMGGGQPESQSMKAELWGGHSKEPEGWENTIYVTYAVGFVIVSMTLGMAPETSIKAWASNEAQARLDLLKEGKVEKIEFGTHYNTTDRMYDFDSPNPDNPFNEEEDDDEDDDEEEEEEEEEEDDE